MSKSRFELQAAMSRQAQAERERQARVILGESEVQIAEQFNQAAKGLCFQVWLTTVCVGAALAVAA